MTPDQKAEQIKRGYQMALLTQGLTLDIVAPYLSILARQYITQHLDDTQNLQAGDYKMQGYTHEWVNFTSYWYDVLNCV